MRLQTALLPVLLLLACRSGLAQTGTLLEAKGWLESAMVTWRGDDGADRYHVYFTDGQSPKQRIDDRLIREYDGYFRADIPGLSPGAYWIQVVPVISGSEQDGATSEKLTVRPNDRSGFAFSGDQMPGAYNANGSLKEGAVVLYITRQNVNSVSLTVTGAKETPCVGLQNILDGFKKGKDPRPLCIRLIGQIPDPELTKHGDLVLENRNSPQGGITFEGVGSDAVADGWGLRIKNASYIEVRNLAFMNCDSEEGDNLCLQQDNDHIWIHHLDLFYGHAGGDKDQAKGDGALECKRSDFVTLSYNHFWDTGKSCILGVGSEEPACITYHHNWFDHSDSRHPRVRGHTVHVYNNYFDGNSKYGVGSTKGSSVFVEANYFRNCRFPILVSMQGTDVWDADQQTNDYTDSPIFSKEEGGMVKAFQNFMTGEERFVPMGDRAYRNSGIDFDAVVVQQAEQRIPASIRSYIGGHAYNNFDTDPDLMYSYRAEEPKAARETVMEFAGRMYGGDFKWRFDNEIDDRAHEVNPALKAALRGYETGLLAIQADDSKQTTSTSTPDSPTGQIPVTESAIDIEAAMVHDFTMSGTEDAAITIAGNLSIDKGTVTYGGLTLTRCLKIESSTRITFRTDERADLTLVFNEHYSGKIRVDGTQHLIQDGVLTMTVEPGEHVLSKGDAANLYLIMIRRTP